MKTFIPLYISMLLVCCCGGKQDPSPGPTPPPTPPGPAPEDHYSEFLIPEAEDAAGQTLAFPGAEGGGMFTSGGRGGRIIHVTNLNDSGTGSLRYAIEQSGSRTVVFDVAGIICLSKTLEIKNGDLTIAGQTAPGDGICIKNYATVIKCDNVVIRFLRFRLGDEGPNAGDSEDCIWGRYRKDIILDHCSMSWSIDECASFYANRNMTMQWCLLTESMNNSLHSKGNHGYGGIWGGRDATFHHNLLTNHHSRNPRMDHPEIYDSYLSTHRGNVDLRNLVVYNWGDNSCYGGEGGHFNMVGCWFRKGPDSKNRAYFIDANSIYSGKTDYGYPELYLSGNVHYDYPGIGSTTVYWHDGSGHPNYEALRTTPLKISGPEGKQACVTTHTAEDAKNAVCLYAGASLRRDSVDGRAVNGLENNSGKIIDVPSEAGGWPEYKATESEMRSLKDSDGDGIPDWFEEKFGLDPSDGGDFSAKTLDIKERYTNFEMYLHYLVRNIVSGQIKDGTYTNY